MPGIQILDVQPDGDDGYMVHWYDPANLDGQPLEGFFHVTEDSLEELMQNQRRPNRASEERLQNVRARVATKRGKQDRRQDLDEIGEAFREAYDEVLTDDIDRQRLGLKAVTRHGHEDLQAVRKGAPVRPWNAVKRPGRERFEEYVRSRVDGGNR